MIELWEELDFHSVTYADGPDGTCRHAWYATCMHTWLKLSDSRDSGEDMKECGRGQSERHAKSWRGRKKDKGRALPLPSFLPIFLFFVLFCFFLLHVRAFSIQRTRLSRSLEHTKAEEGLRFRLLTSDFWSHGRSFLYARYARTYLKKSCTKET